MENNECSYTHALGCRFRGSKYNMEKTKRKLVLFYHYRREYPFYYKGFSFDDPKIKRVLDRGAFLPLPAYDALGRRILVSNSSVIDRMN